jgi:hypothetical protein
MSENLSRCISFAVLSSGLPVQKLFAALALLAVLSMGCDGEAETRAEARSLLEKLQSLSGEGTLSQRKAALDALKDLELRFPEHAKARDVCHAAHLQLLQAETAQLDARKALDEAARAQETGGAPLSPERGRAIAADLQKSNDALAASKTAFPKCEKVTLELTRTGR